MQNQIVIISFLLECLMTKRRRWIFISIWTCFSCISTTSFFNNIYYTSV